jgi:hypothetical protein
MMKKILFALISTILLISCAKIEVFHSAVENPKLDNYTTFSFLSWDTGISKFLNEEDEEKLQNLIRKEFESRGLAYTRSGKGDIHIGVHILFKTPKGKEMYVESYEENAAGYNFTDTLFYGNPEGEANRPVGTLIIDVFDRKSKTLLWQGGAVGIIQAGTGGPEPLMEKAVTKVFELYPVAPIKNTKK